MKLILKISTTTDQFVSKYKKDTIKDYQLKPIKHLKEYGLLNIQKINFKEKKEAKNIIALISNFINRMQARRKIINIVKTNVSKICHTVLR